ncbi:CotO family spore coat protein [Thermaerobacillus caldiproteolyticus]|uniref:Spore coat protein CotO n=1 Tax=Thermaerobacillus caldiproteolyticus TaxID=247480 RepID=A0A7V9Z6M3_9BACL|nr:CotO family spore coat protein [Anoxybacillus caldiproteolyticus]MBA2874951.1 hypothetical protein [Anoxybacillus caldiproteolyticus]QPA31749.1 hypothetical protein ISX45_01670 [Anoxybacillus caldiproteolyticus]
MKTNQVVRNEPLLYIVQPKLEPTVSYMQKSFKEEKKSSEKVEKDDRIHETDLKDVEQFFQENVKTKLFQDMDLEEKLQFLTTLPNQLSSIKCQLATKKRNYKGFICEYKNEHVIFQTEKHDKVNIPVEQIVSISLIGLGKEK